jgi:hypothetical protein
VDVFNRPNLRPEFFQFGVRKIEVADERLQETAVQIPADYPSIAERRRSDAAT